MDENQDKKHEFHPMETTSSTLNFVYFDTYFKFMIRLSLVPFTWVYRFLGAVSGVRARSKTIFEVAQI